MSEVVYGGGDALELDALAVYSHPDDAELAAGGTLLKLKSLGYRTGVLDMTRGEMGTRGTREVREEEARADVPGRPGAVRDQHETQPPGDVLLAHWCTILVSVILDGLPMHLRWRWVIALLARQRLCPA